MDSQNHLSLCKILIHILTIRINKYTESSNHTRQNEYILFNSSREFSRGCQLENLVTKGAVNYFQITLSLIQIGRFPFSAVFPILSLTLLGECLSRNAWLYLKNEPHVELSHKPSCSFQHMKIKFCVIPNQP